MDPKEIGQTASKAAWLGLLFLIALLAIGGATVIIGRMPLPWGRPRAERKLWFPRVEGLRIGDLVRVDGMPYGKVDDLHVLPEGGVEVVVKLKQDIEIFSNGKVRIETLALVGGAVVSIQRGDPSSGLMALENGRYRGEVSTPFADTIERAAEMLRTTVTEIQDDIEARGGTLARLIADPKLYEELLAAIKGMEETLRLLREGEGAVPMFLRDPAVADQTRTILDETARSLKEAQRVLARGTNVADQVSAVLTDARAGVGTVGQLLVNEDLYNNANAVLENANDAIEKASEVIDEVRTGRGVVGRAISDPEWSRKVADTLESVRSAAQDVEDITGRLRRGEGSVGRALKEDSLYTQAQETLESVNTFVGRAAKAKLYLGADGIYFTRRRYVHGRVHLRIWPDENKFFHAGLDLYAFNRNTRIPVRGIPPRTRRTLTAFNLQVGWRLPWFPERVIAFKMGLFESQLGFGFEADPPHPIFHGQRLKFLLEARTARTSARDDGFHERAGPVVTRLFVQTPLWHAGNDPFEVIFGHLWLTVGLNSPFRRPEFFAGLGVQWEDRDLRTLISLAGLGL